MIPTKESILSAARLAKISVPEGHMDTFLERVSSVFKWVEQLSLLDTKDIQPLISPIEDMDHQNTTLRQDVIDDGDKAAEILANAPSQGHGMFKTPKVIE